MNEVHLIVNVFTYYADQSHQPKVANCYESEKRYSTKRSQNSSSSEQSNQESNMKDKTRDSKDKKKSYIKFNETTSSSEENEKKSYSKNNKITPNRKNKNEESHMKCDDVTSNNEEEKEKTVENAVFFNVGVVGNQSKLSNQDKSNDIEFKKAFFKVENNQTSSSSSSSSDENVNDNTDSYLKEQKAFPPKYITTGSETQKVSKIWFKSDLEKNRQNTNFPASTTKSYSSQAIERTDSSNSTGDLEFLRGFIQIKKSISPSGSFRVIFF